MVVGGFLCGVSWGEVLPYPLPILDVLGLSCVFPAPVLESTFCMRSLVPFIGKWCWKPRSGHEMCSLLTDWLCVYSVVSDSVILCTVARQALLPMGLPRRESWSGLPFPGCLSQGIFLTQGSNPCLLWRLHWQDHWATLGSFSTDRRREYLHESAFLSPLYLSTCGFSKKCTGESGMESVNFICHSLQL